MASSYRMEISPIRDDAETRVCAEMMASTEPWLTIGRTADECYALLGDPLRETFVARENDALLGFVVIVMQGAFVGYIQAICVTPDARGSGGGTQLVAFAECLSLRLVVQSARSRALRTARLHAGRRADRLSDPRPFRGADAQEHCADSGVPPMRRSSQCMEVTTLAARDRWMESHRHIRDRCVGVAGRVHGDAAGAPQMLQRLV
jgi:GNAT superfamily N-acetyltransferase